MKLLTVDLRSLLDSCKVGIEATRGLEHTWDHSSTADDTAKAKLLRDLERKRDGLRELLLARAKPAISDLAKKRGAIAVLEKSVVLWTEAEDITALIMAAVDEGGPLTL